MGWRILVTNFILCDLYSVDGLKGWHFGFHKGFGDSRRFKETRLDGQSDYFGAPNDTNWLAGSLGGIYIRIFGSLGWQGTCIILIASPIREKRISLR